MAVLLRKAAALKRICGRCAPQNAFKAINLGNDTDTIAALTGGLAGILYGCNDIPENWVQCMARKKDIYELVSAFAKSLFDTK